MSAIVAVGSAFRGAFGGPELWEDEERWVFVGGLRVAMLVVCVGGGVFRGDLVMTARCSCFGAASRRLWG